MAKNKNFSAAIFEGMTWNVLVLGIVSLLNDLSSQMVFPLIPLFLSSVLGAGGRAVGIVEGAAETTASLLKVFSGYWSDKIKKRKAIVLFGYGLSTLTKPLFVLSTTWFWVVFVRVMERIGKGIRTAPRDAIVAESCDRRFWGKAYGVHRAMDGLGSVLGAVMAFFLLPLIGFKKIFLWAFFPGIIATLAILFVKEKNTAEASSGPAEDKAKNAGAARAGGSERLPFKLRLFIFIAAVFALGHFGYAFILLKAKQVGLNDERALLLYVIFYAVYTLCAVPAGMLSDKIGRKPVLAAGYLLFALTSLGLIRVSSQGGVLFFFMVYGMFYAIVDGVQRAFVADLAPRHLKATALGMFHTAIGIVALPGGYFAGWLWDKVSPQATFWYGFVLSIISVSLLLLVRQEPRASSVMDK
ncbi:MAG: MFS transporter [Candidatus Omnitrophica bacterium]|nr:MFS transporter [Candidatus Omnitrophota bacterium]